MTETLPTTLYHGTSSRFLRSILKHGLKPRGKSKGQWANAPSRPDHVYLTNSYASHFAREACDADDKIAKQAILRIDVAKLQTCRLHADEDALEQANRHRDKEEMPTIEERTNFYRDNWQYIPAAKNWQGSLRVLGNCSHHGPIPASAITGIALIDNRSALSWACDPFISLANYRVLGGYYRALTRYPFEGEAGIDAEVAAMDDDTRAMTPDIYIANLRRMKDGFVAFERPRDSNAKIIAEAERDWTPAKKARTA